MEIEIYGYEIEEERFPSAAPSTEKPTPTLLNLALATNGANATQISTVAAVSPASGAIDGTIYGNSSARLNFAQYSKTGLVNAPWWQVELASLSEIREIKLHTGGKCQCHQQLLLLLDKPESLAFFCRSELIFAAFFLRRAHNPGVCCWTWLNDFLVQIFDADGTEVESLFISGRGRDTGTFSDGWDGDIPVVLDFSTWPTFSAAFPVGKKVKISVTAAPNKTTRLAFSEVEIFGLHCSDPDACIPMPSSAPSRLTSAPSQSPSLSMTPTSSTKPSALPSTSPSFSNHAYINELDTLLTHGRLSLSGQTDILQAAYGKAASETDEEGAQKVVQQLIATSPEFHTISSVQRKTGEERTPTKQGEPANVGYKAILVFNLFGGVDSFNILAPKDGGDCSSLYADYKSVRGVVGMVNAALLPINATGSDQPCDDFGVHSLLESFQSIYEAGDGLFLANFGHLSKPVTKNDWLLETRTDLFSHFKMNYEAQKVDGFREQVGTGVLGRLLDVMEVKKNMTVSPISVNALTVMLDGKPELGRNFDILPTKGINTFEPLEDSGLKATVEELNGATKINSGLFGNFFSQGLVDTFNKTSELEDILEDSLAGWSYNINGARGDHFEQVLKMIESASERGVDREAFFVELGGFDAHGEVMANLQANLPTVNDAVGGFYNRLKQEGMLEKVTTIIISEFGRTSTPNTNRGSDHGKFCPACNMYVGILLDLSRAATIIIILEGFYHVT